MTKLGSRATCHRCGQDIEWTGRKDGWRDRGGNRGCVPYRATDGEIIHPLASELHNIRKGRK
jgi:hypothetical protein